MRENQATILIIDDSPEDRAAYRRYLLQDDLYTYTILEEEYGENGLELCRLVKPDAILLDFLLPDIDGLEFLRELKTQIGRADLPVVMLTGQGNEAIAVRAIKGGAQDYLVKGTTTPESLRLAIHSVVEQAHLRWQLERSEQRFRTSVENMLDCFGIYSAVRDRSGRIVDFLVEYVNAAACAENGMTKEEQIGKRLLELLPAHRQVELFDDYCQVVETGKPLLKEALVYADSNKQSLAAAFDIRATKLGDGFVASWRDISDRKRIEAERGQLLAREQAALAASEVARRAAEAANRAKDVFLAMVSHELRNPIAAILMYTQLLQAGKLNEARVSRALETIERSAKLQAQLINDLLDLSRITSGKLRLNIHPVDLIFIIEAAIDTVRLAAQAKAIQIDSVLDPTPGRVLGDVNRLQQVLWNLLSNAIKFTPNGGRIQVQLEPIDNHVQIAVSDTGCGIDAEFLPYVFDHFRQADNGRQGGLGLGLAIVRHLVELHDGTVQVESPGKMQGATFTIKLPLMASAT
jgi:PAS domain S-box-containing protein